MSEMLKSYRWVRTMLASIVGFVQHTITTKSHDGPMAVCNGDSAPSYSMTISFPATKGYVWLSIIDYSGPVKVYNATLLESQRWGNTRINASHKEIDGLPGWIAKNNIMCGDVHVVGTAIQADYRLEPRGNGITGNVEIKGDTAGNSIACTDGDPSWVPSPQENSTLQATLNLINTIHVTKTITHTTYTQEPLYVNVPHSTYSTA